MRPFVDRHIGTDAAAQQVMLEAVGFDSLEALMDAAVPAGIRTAGSDIGEAASETAALAELRELAGRNRVRHSAIGLGYHGTVTPAPIKRLILENPSWYTAYTPYQPEISQGRLEALINFQTMVADLTGLDIANASMLDEGTAVVEAMLLARRASKSASSVFVVDADLLPQSKALLRHRAHATGIDLVELPLAQTAPADLPESFGVVAQLPGASGLVWDASGIFAASTEMGGVPVAAADLLSLALIEAPGTQGARIAVGSSQRFGVPMGFGGPHAGFMAVAEQFTRQLPGRLVGVSVDADGYPAYRLTLQTREQHIRREKATSNICTAQVLLAVMASMYGVYHGPDGITAIAQGVHSVATRFARSARAAGAELVHESFFDTVRMRVPGRAREMQSRAAAAGILVHVVDDDTLHVAFDETWAEIGTGVPFERLLEALGFEDTSAVGSEPRAIPSSLVRTSEFMTHEVFRAHRSETQLMRYAKRLSDRDYALDRGMIPLGSCTMKLNAAAEMEAITWPEFSQLHPYGPIEDAEGSLALIDQLGEWLARITGYDTVSLQPNAGAQGELAGLLAIRGYHRSRGEEHRDVVLIPASAHGTNAASAVLAGCRVVVVATSTNGDVDLDDLEAKIAAHADDLAGLMITYPSTHGVYESEIRRVCDAVHEAGGQVYIDGANLNALLGHATFGDMGGDVSHLNLHKTFCIPHGGGGPGVGPVAAKAHLAPFLPRDPREESELIDGVRVGANPLSAAPWGSASILPISWAYVRMMGLEGLTKATASAVLAANYVAARLQEHFPVLYTGEHGLVAHECILDLRPLKEATGVSNDDVAKRLVDYGFHAPTMSFPVAGTLMVEPTESEDLAEIDRFIDAMIAIKAEADAIGRGEVPLAESALRRAPHTAGSIVHGEWDRSYTREQAVFPVPGVERAKYWPPVSRIDQPYGDRNIVCSCPPVEAFA
ncbi:glycine dehydrogenase (decarboxylating) alpha subunit /glycine dehydrogenase (decarboxylating) beta subunit [Agrococcus baldri]|uniref:Glycine dehydrogenase (decarboxylating) n=1 Tax=Agrococcus baldri TaxID=153730 RepID=A0AA94HPD4_9MICO|nr:aminomethyl-transferring glycine dehydrogenase [Agrococcus baldri]SFS15302.1 glycine dehydrogenase (decarboxylating) alpha subunit /glycine dehydrogenase (decarboxylating) beta subunit [Agrococcus baldri]